MNAKMVRVAEILYANGQMDTLNFAARGPTFDWNPQSGLDQKAWSFLYTDESGRECMYAINLSHVARLRLFYDGEWEEG